MTQTHSHAKRAALIALMMSALALCGCAPMLQDSEGSSENASRSVSDEGIHCNQFSAATATLSGKVMAYAAPDGVERNDILKLRITGLDSQFGSSEKNYKIRLYRMEGRSDNSIIQDETPLEFRVELPQVGKALPLSGYMTQLDLGIVSHMKTTYALSGATPEEFFRQVDILAFDVGTRWDVIRIALFAQAAGESETIVGYADALMPSFTADPAGYASDHPAVLAEMHPFWSNRSGSYASIAQSWCF